MLHTAALAEDLDPDRLSFVRTLRVVRRQLIAPAAFPLTQVADAVRAAIDEVLTEPLPERRLRACPCAVKRKTSNYPLKPAQHRTWPQPTTSSDQAATILPAAGPTPTTACRDPLT